MANAYFYSNTAQPTTLTGSISSGSTSIAVAAVTGLPGSFPYVLALDYGGVTEELVKVVAASGTTLTVSRGFGGTSAQSHSLGAAVRHVYNAQDASDFRTHEGASSGVHGVTGAVVGTSDAQTLTNKTLSGGVLSGTFTGNPTLSGAPVFSGAASFTGSPVFSGTPSLTGTLMASGLMQSTLASASTVARASIVTADSFDRFRVLADGQQQWGPGSSTRDAFLLREAAGQLATTDTGLRAYRASASSTALSTRVAADTVSRLDILADGHHYWGPGGSTAVDTELYRSAAGVLRTAGAFTIDGALSAANLTLGAWQTYTPTWTTTGTAPSLGNGTLIGRYVQIGRLYVVHINLTSGSTTTYGTNGYSFGLPVQAANVGASWVGAAHLLGIARWTGSNIVSPGATTTGPFFPTASGDTRLVALSGTSPETLATGAQIRATFAYESAS